MTKLQNRRENENNIASYDKFKCTRCNHPFIINLALLANDLASTSELSKRQPLTDEGITENSAAIASAWLKNIPVDLWKTIINWGLSTGYLDTYKQGIVQGIIDNIKAKKAFSEYQLKNGPEIIELIVELAPELLEEISEAEVSDETARIERTSVNPVTELSEVDVIREVFLIPSQTWFRLIEWGKNSNKLSPLERSFCVTVRKKTSRGDELTYDQARNALRIVKEAHDKGFKAN